MVPAFWKVSLCSLVDSTYILEESVASAFRRVKVYHYPEDGSSKCFSFRKIHASACHKVTAVPIATVIISNVIYPVHLKLLDVLGTLRMSNVLIYS